MLARLLQKTALSSLGLALFSFASLAQAPAELPAEVVAAHEAGRYAAVETADGFGAFNAGQAWRLSFDGRGVLVEPDANTWTWGLKLVRYGFADCERDVGECAAASADGGRVTYAWDDSLEEWYINDGRGLEHGFTVNERPAQADEQGGPLTLTVSIRGELRLAVQADRRGLAFLARDGSTALTYSGLTVFDADGQSLPAWFEEHAEGFRIMVDEREARYPLTIDPVAQEAYIKASNPGSFDGFGQVLSISGDTLLVGARREDSDGVGIDGVQNNNNAVNSGAVYVYVRSGTSWAQQAYLKAPTSIVGHQFGSAVTVSGDVAVVGADFPGTGIAYVYRRTGTSWAFEQALNASNADIGDGFGEALGISGDTIFVGASGEDSAAVGIDGNQLDNSLERAGAVYVFERVGTAWVQDAYIKASNTNDQDAFGESLSVFGDTLVVAAPTEESDATGINGDQNNNAAPDSGAVYVFVRSGTTWAQEAYIKASNTGLGIAFGNGLGLHGDTLVVGAPNESSAATGINGDQFDTSSPLAGAAYVFVRNAGVWSQEAYVKASNTAVGAAFGQAVAASTDAIVIGSPGESNNAKGVNGNESAGVLSLSGAAYAFTRTGTTWSQVAYLKASNANTQKQYGASVGISGDIVVVGDWDENGGAPGINGDQTDNSEFRSGAAYAYNLDAMLPTNTAGPSLCSGDGGDQMGCVNCPCANNASAGTIGGCLNSFSTSARLFATGDVSVSLHYAAATDLRFSMSGSGPGSLGVLISGSQISPLNVANPCFGIANGAQAINLDGLRCAVMDTRRHGARTADAAGGTGIGNNPWGGEFNPQPGIAQAGGGFVAGQTRYFQAIYRDDANLSCMRGLNTSQAIEIVFGP